MGMDVYGLNPVLTGARPEIDWSSNPSEEEQKHTLPLTTHGMPKTKAHIFVITSGTGDHCGSLSAYFVMMFFPKKQTQRHLNEGYQYDAETALIIADRLKEALEGGSVQVYTSNVKHISIVYL